MMSPGDAFCVIDFGAGTLGIAVVLVEEPDAARGGAGVRVISKVGLDLGGNHIDALLADHAAEAVRLPRGDAVGYNRVFRRLHWRDDSADVEIIYDSGGGARTVPVTVQQRQERIRRWLNEDSPTFLDVDPPAAAGVARFSLDFEIEAQKRLTVSAFDIERRVWVLDRQPVVRLA